MVRPLARTLALLVLVPLAFPGGALAEGPAGGGPGGGPPRPPMPQPPAPKPDQAKPEDAEKPAAPTVSENVDIKGNRFRIRLKNRSLLVGVLPRGKFWERMDAMGDYEECHETDEEAGLRVQYVLGMEGDTFIRREDIAEITDLGALTEEEKQAIRERVIEDRRKVLAEREKSLKAEMDLIRSLADKEDDAAAKAAAAARAGDGSAEGGEKKPEISEEERRGEELLARFPPPDWGDKRKQEIEERRVIAGIFPDADETDFLRDFNAWKEALRRRERIEAEKKLKEAEEAVKKATEAETGKKDEKK